MDQVGGRHDPPRTVDEFFGHRRGAEDEGLKGRQGRLRLFQMLDRHADDGRDEQGPVDPAFPNRRDDLGGNHLRQDDHRRAADQGERDQVDGGDVEHRQADQHDVAGQHGAEMGRAFLGDRRHAALGERRALGMAGRAGGVELEERGVRVGGNRGNGPCIRPGLHERFQIVRNIEHGDAVGADLGQDLPARAVRKGDLRVCVIEDVGNFRCSQAGVNRHEHKAGERGGQHQLDKPRPVRGQHDRPVAPPDAAVLQGSGERPGAPAQRFERTIRAALEAYRNAGVRCCHRRFEPRPESAAGSVCRTRRLYRRSIVHRSCLSQFIRGYLLPTATYIELS